MKGSVRLRSHKASELCTQTGTWPFPKTLPLTTLHSYSPSPPPPVVID